ncbi:MAG: HesA/MoeB/ThiF family protein [Streptococcaceae bacterium]|nr:HesA/MoeB/ThiF family protein [Streptococcaceae bacterium]
MNISERYKRQIQISEVGSEGQEKLLHSSVLIVGMGATGTHAAEQLTRAGVGHLILVDDDVIEESNLQRQTLFTESDLGQSKAEIAHRHLTDISNQTQIENFNVKFEHLIFEKLEKPDLILDCTDNFLARELINDYCLQEEIPFVYSAVAGVSGQVMAFEPHISPCLACAFPELTELEQNCESIGVITPTISFISSLQISLALQILVDKSQINFNQMKVADVWRGTIDKFTITKRPACPVCSASKVTPQLSKSCGDVYKALINDFDLQQFNNFCQNKNWQIKTNQLATQINLPDGNITIFNTGRILFYNFTQENAERAFKEILSYD